MQTEQMTLSSLPDNEHPLLATSLYSHRPTPVSNRLNWLHFEFEPLRWLGLVRAIAEPRLPPESTFNLQQLHSPDDIRAALDTEWKVVSCVHSFENAPLQWHTLYQLRQAFPHALRVVCASPTHPHRQLRLREAGAHCLIPDALALCHWLSQWIGTEYPHR